MNVLIVSNADIRFDMRLKELIKIGNLLGECFVITSSNVNIKRLNDKHFIYYNRLFGYIGFILFCLKVAKRINNIDILLCDNRQAIIPSFLIKYFFQPRYSIQDVRELYLIEEVKSYRRKLVCYLEQLFMYKNDIIIAANKYRADVMKKKFGLRTLPLVFENIRFLNYNEENSYKIAESKYSKLFKKDAFKIISTSGCSFDRTNDLLVKAIAVLPFDIQLFLVGNSSEQELLEMNNLIKEYGVDNKVIVLPMIIEDDLKYIISKCDVGVVNYSQEDTNNRYCASGKIYEFIFEEKPVVCTNNPPLVDICKTYEVGVADNNYEKSISEIIKNYPKYLCKVKKYKKELMNTNEIKKIIDIIKERIC